MQNEQMKKMMNGAIVLSAASFVTKLLSAVYKVPFQNLTGDEGFYVYQQIYPLYGIAASLSLNGLPVFVSKLTAELPSSGERKTALKRVLTLLLAAAFFLWAVCWFGAPMIARWMGDDQLASLIRSVSFVYLVVPFLAVTRGYFQGGLNMMPTGISQIGEQVVRVSIILFAAVWFTRSGWSVYEMGSVALSSSWVAGIAAAGILVWYWKKETSQEKPAASVLVSPVSYRKLTKRLATEGLAISAFGSLLILLQLIDSFTVYNGLLDHGLTEAAAMTEKGIYDRGQPLVQLGMVIGTSFSSSLLPLLSRQLAEKQTQNFQRTASSVLRITSVFASAATVGLILLMPQFNQTLFSDTAGTSVLQVYMLGILAASLIGAANAILQSLDKQKPAMIGLAAGIAVKAVLNRWMVAGIGTIGASLSTAAALFVVWVILQLSVTKKLGKAAFSFSFLAKLVLSLAAMSAGVYAVVSLAAIWLPAEDRAVSLLLALIGVAVGAGVFGTVLLATRTLSMREWLSLPFGRKLLKRRQKQ